MHSESTAYSHVIDDSDHTDPSLSQKSWHHTRTGWPVGILSAAILSFLIFLLNFLFTVITVAKQGYAADGRQTLYDGACSETRTLNVGVHVLINVFSTALLGASNYAMQCLVAPTRGELDKTHVKGGWMDVGVLSLRNLRGVGRRKVVLWGLLGVTSLPLHLFYNSVIFSSIAANEYQIFTVNPAFVAGSFNYTDPYCGGEDAATTLGNCSGKRLHTLANANNGSLQRLSPADCITAYGQNFVTDRNTLLLVVNTTSNPRDSSPAAILQMTASQNEEAGCNRPNEKYPWICQQDGSSCRSKDYTPCESRLDAIKANASGWQPFEADYPVLYCLSETVPEHCKLQFSFQLGIIVTVLNLAKVIIFAYLVLSGLNTPLMTVGDAIASFLDRPDAATEGMSLLAKDDVVKGKSGNWTHNPVYRAERRRWFAAASKTRWIVCISMYIAALSTCAALLIHFIPYIQSLSHLSTRALLNLGLGAVTPLTFILWNIPSRGVSGLMSNVLVANTPQLILSLLYFTLNGLATAMYNAYEWSRYARARKGLRVSTPRGEQRSTYFLSLPYRVAMPLMAASGVLHWLVSQSLFLVVIEGYAFRESDGDDGGRLRHDVYNDQMTCGWSPVGILCTVLVGVALVGWVLVLGLRRFGTGMPVAGGCSVAIAAACHGAGGEEEAALKRVQWGVTGVKNGGLAQCGFSAGSVEEPQDGVLYK
ncbi:hypothetical protein BU16DRAFT_574727 [Lophium mytilinum]|uniref:DUF6536 domain-containing protein n=1 Tax=Lophium mytilinum TaxID=390894 RepID=A0A6A6QIB2_9PEZI|nr:hypothetical protein BU16DRAFT_574727 [Lophium mytilinum]